MTRLIPKAKSKSADGRKSAICRGELRAIASVLLLLLFTAGSHAQSLPACPSVTWFKQKASPSQEGDILCALVFIADGRTAIAPSTCVDERTQLAFGNSKGASISASVVAKSEEVGLAVLRHSGCEGGYMLSQAVPKAGDPLSYIGLIEGAPRQIAVTAKTPQPKKVGEIIAVETSRESFPGGSPLLVESGELIGILTHFLVNKEGARSNIAMAIGLIPIRYAVEEVDKVGMIRRPARLGLAVQDFTPELAAVFEIEPQGGVVISKVTMGSAGEAQGLRMGDVVTAINGTPLEGIDHFFTFISYRHLGDSLTFEIIRDGRRFKKRLIYSDN